MRGQPRGFVSKDIMQMAGSRKYTVPEVRLWVYPKGGGDDYALYKKARTPGQLKAAWKHFTSPETRGYVKRTEGTPESSPLIAYKGYEYSQRAFYKKYPSWKRTAKKKRK